MSRSANVHDGLMIRLPQYTAIMNSLLRSSVLFSCTEAILIIADRSINLRSITTREFPGFAEREAPRYTILDKSTIISDKSGAANSAIDDAICC